MTWLDGHKTYLIAAATIAYGIIGYLFGGMPMSEAAPLVLGGSGLGALRHGVSKGGQ